MPPKITITKEMIQKTAFSHLRINGMDCINARFLAEQIGCSTQPIFRVYKNMEELKQDLISMAEDLYNQKMEEGMTHKIPFLGMGLAYIRFAAENPKLFHLLFLEYRYTIYSFDEMIHGPDNDALVAMLSQVTGGTKDQCKRLFIGIWLLTHGIATMLATNTTQISPTEIEQILWDGYAGLKKQILGD